MKIKKIYKHTIPSTGVVKLSDIVDGDTSLFYIQNLSLTNALIYGVKTDAVFAEIEPKNIVGLYEIDYKETAGVENSESVNMYLTTVGTALETVDVAIIEIEGV